MKFLALSTIAVATAAAQSDKYTATKVSAVRAAAATAKTSHKTSHVQGKVFDRFLTIWLENTDYDKAAGDPSLVALAKQGITLSNYFGVTHPSEPNYCASHGGDNFGMDNDNFNQVVANVSAVTALLEDKGISWGSYQEDMPYTGFEGNAWINHKTKANDYVRKHNPPVLYNRNTGAHRLTYQKNTTIFYQDLENETLPQWVSSACHKPPPRHHSSPPSVQTFANIYCSLRQAFITPNMTSDGHDSSVTVAGAWTKGFLEPLLSNKYFMDRTLILITFDENETYEIPNRVFSILLGGAVPDSLKGTTDSNYYVRYHLKSLP